MKFMLFLPACHQDMVAGLACCAIPWESEVSLLCTASAPLDAVEGVTDGSASAAGLLAYMMHYVSHLDISF